MNKLIITILLLGCMTCLNAQRHLRVRTIPLDSIVMSDPCILADSATQMYYMTGTGGMLWKSYDLKMWTGPYRVAMTEDVKWMGSRPEIWAAELHKYRGKYYYFATFTNNAIRIDSVRGNVIPRRACHVLVSDKAEGPYRPVGKKDYLPAGQPTLDGTLWVDKDKHPYMVFCGEWLQNWNGTVEKIRLKDDLSGSVGKAKVLFHAYDSPWSRERDDDGTVHANKVTDGPWLFRTQTGRLGMIWTSWVYNDYTQGVAYSESGTLDGPWIQQAEPITPPNFGHGMLFRTLDGKLMMSVHSHEKRNGRTHRVPHLFPVDDSGDRIRVDASSVLSADNMPGNPVITHMYSADPSAHVFNDTLWVYPSHDKDDAVSFSMEDYHAYSTTDMRHWKDWGVIFNPLTQTAWAKEAAWAPDCIERNGKYYLYYPTDKRHIGVAVGDTPHGPFHDPLGHPLISIDTPGVVCNRDFIDPSVFIDDDGQAYLFMGQNTVCAVKLNDDMVSYDKSGGDHGVYIIDGVHEFFEAVWVHKRNGRYYMSYSDGPFFGHEPQISYCTADSPLGPYTYQGVILDPVNSGTNHHSIVKYKGQDYLFYHTADISRTRRPGFHCGVRRNVCVDKLFYNADGTIQKVVPTLNSKKVERAAQ